MTESNIEKIRSLLTHDKIEFVHQAFELWLAVTTDVESFLRVLQVDTSTEPVITIQVSTAPFVHRVAVLR